MLITVFTPTYNRAHLLSRLYDSLCKQTYIDFEWVIVDDGSSDKTDEVVLSFISNKLFSINYIKQKNGGKHRAINRGVKEAKGELFFIVDSDDMLPVDALANVSKTYEDIKDDNSFAGVCGLDGTLDGKIIGCGLQKDIVDENSLNIRVRNGVTGDMKEVFKTSVLKEFPFPEIKNEKFCPEMLLWNRIATKYKLRYFNKVIYFAEYQSDGITSGIVRARMNSPIASMMTYAEMTKYKNVPILEKCKSAINYWRFYLCSKQHSVKPRIAMIWSLLFPVGIIMHLRDIRLTR